MAEEEGYRVVPGALRNAQQAFDAAAGQWTTFHRFNLPGWRMEPGTLGLLGRLAGVVGDYNGAVDTISNTVESGIAEFTAGSDALHESANAYEAQEEDYYAEFGYVDRDLGDVAPPPGG